MIPCRFKASVLCCHIGNVSIPYFSPSGNLTTNHIVKIGFTFLEFSTIKIVMWNCHVDDSTKIRYNLILGRYLLTSLRLYLEFSNTVIEGGNGPFEIFTASMVDLGTYDFDFLVQVKLHPKIISQIHT